MDKFYTVDRSRSLIEGTQISLDIFGDIKPLELQTHINRLLPDGVSRHGDSYLLNKNSGTHISSPAIELLLEYVRRAHFPNVVSRYQSLFASETIDEARSFRNNHGKPDSPIFEVLTTNRHFKGNMTLLARDQTSLVCSYFADEYWKGQPGPPQMPRAVWEILLELPVEIGRKIE